ncbi:MAG TPA: hypothetical protein PKE26_16610 [Kiritimatiellia bacterium]|nr:hypothetical protein [Kiritimatiellia bacterium]
MSSIDSAQIKVDGTCKPAGSSLGKPRDGLDLWGRQVVALVKPGDVVSPSKSIRENDLKRRSQ